MATVQDLLIILSKYNLDTKVNCRDYHGNNPLPFKLISVDENEISIVAVREDYESR